MFPRYSLSSDRSCRPADNPAGPTRLQFFACLFEAVTQLGDLIEIGPGQLFETLLPELLPGLFGRLLPDVGAAPALGGDQAGLVQHAVGAPHGVEVDAQLGGQFADGRELIAQAEGARGHEAFDLAGDLEVDRLVGTEIELDLACERVHAVRPRCINEVLYLCIIDQIVCMLTVFVKGGAWPRAGLGRVIEAEISLRSCNACTCFFLTIEWVFCKMAQWPHPP